MSDSTKVKVIDIRTGGAKKSVDSLTQSFIPLRKQIRDLQNQLGQLEKGTLEYERTATQLADLMQKQREIQETAKYSNKDFGATMTNLTNVSMGLVGGINALSASMVMLGQDSEDMQKALVPIQLTMAAIQGFTQLDRALKSLNGLKNVFIGVSESAESTAKSVESVTHTVDTLASATTKIDGSSLDSLSSSATTATTAIATGSAKASKGLSGIVLGFKNAAKAVKSFIASNPILLAIAAAIGAVVAAIGFMNKKMQEAGKVAKEQADILTSVNTKYEEQTIKLNVLLKTARDENATLKERQSAINELNKTIPNYNGKLDETSKKYTENAEALDKYLYNLQQKLKYEAYEGKIKEYLQEQEKIQQKINKLQTTGWFFVQLRIKKNQREVKMLEQDIKRVLGYIDNLDMSGVLSDNKVYTSSKGATKQLKEIIEVLKETKKYAEDFWDTFYNSKRSRRKMEGPSSLFKDFEDSLNNVLHKYDLLAVKFDQTTKSAAYSLTESFTKEFKNILRQGEEYSGKLLKGFTMSDIFTKEGMDNFQNLQEQLKEYAGKVDIINDIYKKLADTQGGQLTEAQTKEYEEAKKVFDLKITSLQKELKGYEEVMNVIYEYTDSLRDLQSAQFDLNLSNQKHNEQLKIEKEYLQDIKKENPLADINKTIKSQELEYDTLSTINEELKKRRDILVENSNSNGQYKDKIEELNKQILENERELANQEIQLDKNKWTRRLQEAENYYNKIFLQVGREQEQLGKTNYLLGGGVSAYNTEYNQQKILIDRLTKEREINQSNYDNQLIDYETFLAKKNELDKRYNEETVKLDQLAVENKVNTWNAAYSAMQSVYGAIGDILDNEMSKYEEGSEEYKRLAVAKAISDTIMGSLSAFVSGVQSGLIFPANFFLGAALAGTTTALGLSSISKIKSGEVGGSSANLTSGASSIGTNTYETVAFSNNSELLGKIKDNRVYVLENDISSTQNRVRVREQQSQF